MSATVGPAGRGVNVSGRIKRTRQPSFIDSIHRRTRIAFLFLVVFFAVLAGELVWLQLRLNTYFTQRASLIRVHTVPIDAERGRILDRNGNPLAVDVQVADVIADPTQISDPVATAAKVAELFGASQTSNGVQSPALDPAALAQKLIRGRSTFVPNSKGQIVPLRYVPITTSVPYSSAQAFNTELANEQKLARHSKSYNVCLNGIHLLFREQRSYPNGDLGAQILGFVQKTAIGSTNETLLKGHLGIEGKMNNVLTGNNGSVTNEEDPSGKVISSLTGSVQPAISGGDVRLTIDSTIQRFAQNELQKSCEKYKADYGTVIVVDPNNGDILALANNPTFDPNQPSKYNPGNWGDPAVSNLYEPGSTMKTLTLSAVLDTLGLNTMYDTITCTGKLQVGNRVIHCADDPPTYGHHGTETMREVMENSCNIGAYLFASRIGAQRLYDYEGRFGLFDKPNSGLPYERYCGLVPPTPGHDWPAIELANVAFGQGISLTPLQVASIYATIAHNGVVVHPHILMTNGYSGPPQAAVRPEVAQAMMSMLQSVVQKGTGQPAKLDGYTIGGKTGSAQVFEHGSYGQHFVGSFVGIAPLNHPRLVVLCAIFNPKGMHWGAVVAAPVVRNITEASLKYLRVPEDNPTYLDTAQVAPDYGQPGVKTSTAKAVSGG